MSPTLGRYLESIRTCRESQDYDRALQLIEEAFQKGLAGAELVHESVGISLVHEPWRKTLERINPALSMYRLQDICGDDNRKDFLRLVREYSGFRTMLMEHLHMIGNYQAFSDWVGLADPEEQQWLIKTWTKMAAEAESAEKAGAYLAAAGAGLFAVGDWDAAWTQWGYALERDPALLAKIMTLCKQSDRLDMNNPRHRLLLIHLVAASGKHKESMSLIQALAMESPANARAIFMEMPGFIPVDRKSREYAELRYNLALHLQDLELIFTVLGELDHLSERDLFYFKKQTMTKIRNPKHRRKALLEYVKLYIRIHDWENGALLLEVLYEESPRADIIALMEHVADHYPVMSRLNYLIGKYHLEHDNLPKARKYLEIISGIKEYHKDLMVIIMDYLAGHYDPGLANMLYGMLPPISHRASAVAMDMMFRMGPNCGPLLKKIGTWKSRKQPSPFWYIAMIHGNLELDHPAKAYEHLCHFLLNYAKLSQEVFRYAQHLTKVYHGDCSKLVKLIDTFGNVLEPKKGWGDLAEAFDDITRHEQHTGPQVEIPVPVQGDTGPVPMQATPGSAAPGQAAAMPAVTEIEPGERQGPAGAEDFKRALAAGNLPEAARVVRAMVAENPEKAPMVLEKLAELSRAHPREPIWITSSLGILLHTKQYAAAVKMGQAALENPHFQENLSDFYQFTAEAFRGLGHETEALRFFCLASREEQYYEKNRNLLQEMLFPKNHHFLKEVLQLVLINEDEQSWEVLMRAWHTHNPDEISHLIKAHVTFTNRVETPGSILGLAFWYLQAGKTNEVNNTLNRIDLRNPEIRESLVHLINLAHLKHPDDPKPKFMLARYYLVHKEVSKAVDTFRNMAKDAPTTAEPIFQFIRTYLKKKPDSIEMIHLYGLLIRFALAYGTPIAAIKLLDEFGKIDQEGAAGLCDGVFRVLCEKGDNLESIYQLVRLQHQWGAFRKMLKFNDKGGLGNHMAYERLQWLHDAARDEELRDRALLASARLYFDLLDFDKCRAVLHRIQSHGFRQQALTIYAKLTSRFADDMDLWREAGWAAFCEDKQRAVECFRKIVEADNRENMVEAYAALIELDDEPDFEVIANITADQNRLLSHLNEVFCHIRELELGYWEEKGGEMPERGLDWLIFSKQLSRFQELLPLVREHGGAVARRLEARFLLAKGQNAAAAWCMTRGEVDHQVLESYFYNADLLDYAIYRKKPHTRLPSYLRTAFLDSRQGPRMIKARISMIRALQQATPDTDQPN